MGKSLLITAFTFLHSPNQCIRSLLIWPLLKRLGQKMYKISLVFWRMGEIGILLLIFTDLYGLLGKSWFPKKNTGLYSLHNQTLICWCFKKIYRENKSGPTDRKETHCEVAVLLPLLLLLFVVGKAQRKLLNFYLLECFLKPLHLQ